jgi:hypothetical protein
MGSARPRRRRAAAGRRRPRAGADTGRRRRGDHRGRCPGCRQPSHGTAGARRLLPVRRHRRTRRTRCSSAEQLGDRAIRPHRAHGAVRRPRPLTTAPAHPPSGAHRRGDRGGRAAPRARPLRSGSLTDAPAARPGGRLRTATAFTDQSAPIKGGGGLAAAHQFKHSDPSARQGLGENIAQATAGSRAAAQLADLWGDPGEAVFQARHLSQCHHRSRQDGRSLHPGDLESHHQRRMWAGQRWDQ